VLRSLELAQLDPANATRYLTFVFVGGGYAGVEALAEMRQLVRDAWRHYPGLHGRRPTWILVDAAPRILGEVPGRLSADATRRLVRDGVRVRSSTYLVRAEPDAVVLSCGTRIATNTLVWTAGVVPTTLAGRLGLPQDDRGRIQVGPTLQVEGRDNVWALGDCAAVPNAATPDRTDPPTCQHALRQARSVVRSMRGGSKPYRYRSMGQGATLGRMKGVARIFGVSLRGLPASIVMRWYHALQVPQLSRMLRIAADSLLSLVFGRDTVELPGLDGRR
jgi:NADH dehydrogenase